MRRALALALLVAGCGRPAASAPTVAPADKPAAAPGPRAPGDGIAYRFVDHAGEATLTSPPLSEAWNALGYPAKLVDPYTGLRGDEVFRVVELALADADVASYGTPHPIAPQKARTLRFDPVWNRTRAVYESKRALFAPGETRYLFSSPRAAHGELQAWLAVPPGGSDVQFVVEIDGKPRLERTVPAAQAGAWIAVTQPLEAGAHQIALVTHGSSPAFWGDPLIVDRGAGRPTPNVLFVVIDTLRVDALPAMPRLRALAADGTSFTQAITAATWTRPSVLAMLGGDLPTALGQGAEEMIPSDGDRRRFYAIAPPLLPRVLAARGYRSVAIGNNFFLLGYPQIGLTLGFEEVADIRHPVLDTPAISNAAVAFIEAHRDEPWFLHLHYDAPHWPYTPPPAYLAKVPAMPFPEDPMARAYLAEAAYADDYLGRVLDALDRLKLSERTLVVVVGDHGEIFDHAHSETVEALHQPTLHHHGWSGYDELLRVPLVMRMPGTIPKTTIPEQVSFVDLEPTIRELVGMAPRDGERGRSLVPLWHGAKPPERPAFVEGQDVRVVRAGGWAYLRRSDGRLTLDGGRRVVRTEELYDVAHDPAEHTDLAERDPDELAKMRALFDREAPTPRDAPVAVVHLRVAPDERAHVVDGTLQSDGAISLRGVAGAEASPVDAHTLRLTLRGAAEVDLAIDPPTARITLALKRDGTPVTARQVLLGEFALPLLAGADELRLDGERLTWIDAARPPQPGDRGEILLWRDPNPITSLTLPATAKSSSEVAGMMRRWGYAQPGSK
ncbi:MAG TPA: sulfatase-like hydrolase/transferase [Polyangia bacterium]|nr:sulfatase-like hydrolase/transferase [Polyangia bacterium]